MADGDVTDIATEPSLAELQEQLKAQNERLAAMAKKEEMYLQALAEKDTRRPAPKKEEPPEEDLGELDPATKRALDKLQSSHTQQLSQLQDQHDEMSFMQYAASAGIDPQVVAETAKMYADYRASGVRVRGHDGQERPMTRADVMFQVIGRRSVADQFKQAPERNLQALKSKIIGPAGFDGGASAGEGPRYVKIDSEIDKLPTKDRSSKLEKALSNLEF